MFQAIIESLIQILHQDGFTNLVVSHTLASTTFTEHEKKLYTKLVYGVVEHKMKIDYQLQPFIQGKRVKPYLKNALRVGAYGLDYLEVKDYFLVNALVDTVKKKDYKGSLFVNAILRKYQATPRRKIEGQNMEALAIRYSIPVELLALLKHQYPKEIESILSCRSHHLNMYRINTLLTSCVEVEQILQQENISYQIEKSVILKTESSLLHHPLFQQGKITPQDASSIQVGFVVQPNFGARILDVCSAPGSKAMHLAAMIGNQGTIVACDIYEHKLKLIEEAASRLGVTCVTTCLKDGKTAQFAEPFDYILIDAPCSGLGVMHHKPDLKYHMSLAKIDAIKKEQAAILENSCANLKKGGILVYSTCTINQDENEKMIRTFIAHHKEFQIVEEHNFLPTIDQDGFYICKLKERMDETQYL
ncbi:MAG: 16S rRNA (cytosine(967)-C(5))-methyltransferase RsmB [Anaeroplasma bactoclasticum]|nr:16S rRNA (cytosine(967)-C(5))-methyltransferase RsmB [Anaeroplasma bactoclasticum]